MPLNESSAGEPRERWPREFDIIGIPRDQKTRESVLEYYRQTGEIKMPVDQLPINGKVVDPYHPNFNSRRDTENVQPYTFEEFPKMLYSDTFDNRIETLRAQIAAHNRTLRDPLQCRQLPERVRLTKVVQNQSEEAIWLKKGYTTKPPAALEPEQIEEIDSAYLSAAEQKQRASMGLKK